MTRRYRTQAERDAARARWVAAVAAETERLRRQVEEAESRRTPEERAALAAEAIRRFGGAA